MIGAFFSQWQASARFSALPREARSVVFYAESRADWVHFEPIIEALTGPHQRAVAYVTSDAGDPVLTTTNPQIRPFAVGSGSACTVLFKTLDADVMVMTLPDLDAFHLKRSVNRVHYVYVCHSLASTHTVLRRGSLDAFDTVLCGGPHHHREILRTEEVYGLRRKKVVDHGYGRLDAILRRRARREPFVPSPAGAERVLVAPSWGNGSIPEVCGVELVEALLRAGHPTVLRLHPMTCRQRPRLVARFARRFGAHPLFTLETDVCSEESLHRADVMISDWSGAALEFAFGLERPVLFLDVPRKINNPEHERIGCPAAEVVLRTELGAVVAPERVGGVHEEVASLSARRGTIATRIRSVREDWVYNVGTSGEVGARAVIDALRGASSL